MKHVDDKKTPRLKPIDQYAVKDPFLRKRKRGTLSNRLIEASALRTLAFVVWYLLYSKIL